MIHPCEQEVNFKKRQNLGKIGPGSIAHWRTLKKNVKFPCEQISQMLNANRLSKKIAHTNGWYAVMAKMRTTFTVFISAPGDMAEYVASAKEIINQESDQWTEYEMKAIDYTDLASDISGNHPQHVIDHQLEEIGIDLYIGIMGSKFGSATPNFGSGTEAEFQNLFQKQLETGNPQMAFLFYPPKKQAHELEQKDWEEWNKVKTFRDETVGSRGLYHDFFNQADFEKFIRDIIMKFKSKHYKLERYQEHVEIANSAGTQFKLSEEFFSEWLNHPGQSIGKNNESSVTLSDIFERPRLVGKSRVSKQKGSKVKGNRPFYLTEDYKKIPKTLLLRGAEGSGKTTVLKHIYKVAYDYGMIPLVLKCEEIPRGKYEDIFSIFLPLFRKQYDVNKSESIEGIDQSRRVALIDNFDSIKLNQEGRRLFLEQVENHFEQVIVTMKSDVLTNESAILSQNYGMLSEYDNWEIQEFNDKQINGIVTNWLAAGKKYHIGGDEIGGAAGVFQTVREIVGYNYVPRFPFVILVILHGISDGEKAMEMRNPSFVRYYKYLLDKHIFTEFPQARIELAYRFFPFVAQRVFQGNKEEITIPETEQLCSEFSQKFGPRIDNVRETIDAAFHSGILISTGNGYKFRDNYVYYLFLTEHWAERINEEEVINQIKELSENLHLKQSSSILIFLAYQKQHELIIQILLDQLSKALSEENEFDFSNEAAKKLNRLIDEAPRLILDQEANKREEIIEAEEEQTKSISIDVENTEDMSEPERMFQQLIITTRRIEIVGQLIKNHAYEITIDYKSQLFERSINSGLRLTNSLFVLFFSEPEILVNTLKSHLKDNLEEQVSDEVLREFVFAIASSLLAGLMVQWANYFAMEDLESTFENVLEENDSVLAHKMVNFGLKLEYKRSLKNVGIEDMYELCREDKNAVTVMTVMVLRHFYLMPDKYEKGKPRAYRDKICKLLNVDIPFH